MMIAPKAEIDDGLVEYVRWGPIGRLGLIRNLPGLYDGTHIEHPLAERKAFAADRVQTGCSRRRHGRRRSADAALRGIRRASRGAQCRRLISSTRFP